MPPGGSVTAEPYCCDLDEMYPKLQKLSPALANRSGAILLQDNAKAHTAKITRQKLTQLGIEVLSHPTYSPDHSPTDYHFLQAFDSYLRQKKIADLTDVENDSLAFINSRDPGLFSKSLDLLPLHWQRCVDADGF